MANSNSIHSHVSKPSDIELFMMVQLSHFSQLRYTSLFNRSVESSFKMFPQPVDQRQPSTTCTFDNVKIWSVPPITSNAFHS